MHALCGCVLCMRVDHISSMQHWVIVDTCLCAGETMSMCLCAASLSLQQCWSYIYIINIRHSDLPMVFFGCVYLIFKEAVMHFWCLVIHISKCVFRCMCATAKEAPVELCI